MFELEDLKKTRFYQEVKAEGLEEGKQQGVQEGQLAAAARLVDRGFGIEEVAEWLGLSPQQIERYRQQHSEDWAHANDR